MMALELEMIADELSSTRVVPVPRTERDTRRFFFWLGKLGSITSSMNEEMFKFGNRLEEKGLTS
jgi:hypothetical protein